MSASARQNLKSDTEVLPGFSHIHGPHVLNLLSKLCPWKWLPLWVGGWNLWSKDGEGARSLQLPHPAYGSVDSHVLSMTSAESEKYRETLQLCYSVEPSLGSHVSRCECWFHHLRSCVTPHKLLNFANPQILYLKNGNNDTTFMVR